MFKRNIALVDLAADLHSVISILSLIWFLENMRSTSLLCYHIYVIKVGQLGDLEGVLEVPQIDHTKGTVLVEIRKHSKASIRIASQLLRCKLKVVEQLDYKSTHW